MPLTPEQKQRNQQNRAAGTNAKKKPAAPAPTPYTGAPNTNPRYDWTKPNAPQGAAGRTLPGYRPGGKYSANPTQPTATPPAADPWANSNFGQGGGIFGTGSSGASDQHRQANLIVGVDEASGRTYYFAGYNPDGTPAFSFSPTFNPAEFPAGLNRQIGHFQDAVTAGGSFDPSGAFLSNAQGSQYQLDPTAQKLVQTGLFGQAGNTSQSGPGEITRNPDGSIPTGSYSGNTNVNTGTGGGAGVNPNLLNPGGAGAGGGYSSTAGNNPAGGGYSSTGGQTQTAPPPAPNQSGQQYNTAGGYVGSAGPNGDRLYQMGGQGGSAQAYNFGRPGQNSAPSNLNTNYGPTNQAGQFSGGLANQAVYGAPGNTSRLPWQMRLGGGGGMANDRAGFSGSRLF